MGDKDLTNWLNDYCETMASLVHKHGGTGQVYRGRCHGFLWGSPDQGVKEDAIACTRMAIEMLQVVKTDVCIRIGINSGKALVGNFGSLRQRIYIAGT